MLDNSSEKAISPRRVLVCQYRTCRKDGAEQVLVALQQQVIENVTVEACGCLGLCGSGPMVLILPDQVYYWRMNPQKIQKVTESHLLANQPIATMMHPRLHPQ
ncbi:MAG: NADH dehydrogenase (ubiquinone) subunit [Pseudanabaena sp.]|nr:MAG: NADH dehydrogenase (ubiquinone) subunit [Pseudanabaena sp.]